VSLVVGLTVAAVLAAAWPDRRALAANLAAPIGLPAGLGAVALPVLTVF
jgi:hypothetical protein